MEEVRIKWGLESTTHRLGITQEEAMYKCIDFSLTKNYLYLSENKPEAILKEDLNLVLDEMVAELESKIETIQEKLDNPEEAYQQFHMVERSYYEHRYPGLSHQELIEKLNRNKLNRLCELHKHFTSN